MLAPAPRRKRGKKVPLAPGHSQVDWMRLQQKTKPMKPQKVSPEELKNHKSETDLWMVIQGRVYDVTPYLHFHPGGVKELLRGGGRDASKLFSAVHPWVNVHRMLEKQYVGVYSTK